MFYFFFWKEVLYDDLSNSYEGDYNIIWCMGYQIFRIFRRGKMFWNIREEIVQCMYLIFVEFSCRNFLILVMLFIIC